MFEVLDYLRPDGKDPYMEWLAGGDKRKQQATIDTAKKHWNDWQQRRKNP